MDKPVPFMWVDVFAENPLEGNPLAVIEGTSLPEDGLLPLTRELNQAEAAFYYPPTQAGADVRVRIFTMAKEVPFAGHAILGVATALCLSGRLPYQAPQTLVRLELGIGVVEVTVIGAEAPERARFEHRLIAVAGEPITDARLAWLPPALGLSHTQISAVIEGDGPGRLYPQVVSGGALQLMVPVGCAADVEQIAPSALDVVTAERALGADLGLLAFAFVEPPDVTGARPVRVRARFFAADAPQEDPATGSAAAALAVFLHHHGLLQAGQVVEIDQGPLLRYAGAVPGRRGLLRATCDGVTVSVEGRVREVWRGEARILL